MSSPPRTPQQFKNCGDAGISSGTRVLYNGQEFWAKPKGSAVLLFALTDTKMEGTHLYAPRVNSVKKVDQSQSQARKSPINSPSASTAPPPTATSATTALREQVAQLTAQRDAYAKEVAQLQDLLQKRDKEVGLLQAQIKLAAAAVAVGSNRDRDREHRAGGAATHIGSHNFSLAGAALVAVVALIVGFLLASQMQMQPVKLITIQ